jgi:putative ABC transport system permease protein
LTGAIITVAILSSIPIYNNGIMQRMLTKDLEIYQQDTGYYPGGYLIRYDGVYDQNNNAFENYDRKITEIVAKSIQLPVITNCTFISGGFGDIQIPSDGKAATADISALSGMNDHIRITNGKTFSKQKGKDVFEVIASEQAMKELGLTLGKTYEISIPSNLYPSDKPGIYKINVVGIFSYKSKNDAYWYDGIDQYKSTLFMDYDSLKSEFLAKTKRSLNVASWYYAYDYHKINVGNVKTILNTLDVHTKWVEENRPYLDCDFRAKPALDQFGSRSKELAATLLILQIPVLLMLSFYSFMVAKLKIDFESNEIAIIKSRGGSSAFVFWVYLIEVLIIDAIALVAGPLLGFGICRIIGSTNGFLEFVQRTALPLMLNPETYLYSIAAIVFISASMLIPAISASKTSIVLYKQKKSRGGKLVFWKRFYIDFILLAVTAYGFYGYQRQQKILFISGAKGTELEIDPLLFTLSFLFVLGCGLLFLRLFPYIVRITFRIFRKRLSPGLFANFLEISRSSGQEQFIMLFLILTLSIGIFSACSARTLNKNIEDKVRYQTGADITLKAQWFSNQLAAPDQSQGQVQRDLVYFEPPYKSFTELDGVESATKVFRNESTDVKVGDSNLNGVSLMAIIPHEFGKTAWFDTTLLPYHWYNYLNLMTDSPTAVLVSRAFKDNMKANIGDEICMNWGSGKEVAATIVAFVDYWPALNSNKKVEGNPSPYFVVANLNYLQAVRSIEPYEVWLKKKPGATSNDVYKSIEQKKIKLESWKDVTELLVRQKNDPLLQGTNGSLTLGFIATIIITVIGFLIHWIMSLKKRTLQFGIFRAMGLTKREIIGMITFEQILVTGMSVLAGMVIGSAASRIFVPLMQLVYSNEEQVPPFKVIVSMNDYERLFVIVLIMLFICFAVLRRFIAKINIGQAIKLGED